MGSQKGFTTEKLGYTNELLSPTQGSPSVATPFSCSMTPDSLVYSIPSPPDPKYYHEVREVSVLKSLVLNNVT